MKCKENDLARIISQPEALKENINRIVVVRKLYPDHPHYTPDNPIWSVECPSLLRGWNPITERLEESQRITIFDSWLEPIIGQNKRVDTEIEEEKSELKEKIKNAHFS